MTNTPIILRFINGDGAPIRLDVRKVAGLVEALEEAFQTVAVVLIPERVRTYGGEAQVPHLHLRLTASPRAGCIELVFEASFDLHVNVEMLVASLSESSRRDALSALSDLSGIGSFLLALFTALYVKWREKSPSSDAAPQWAGELRDLLAKDASSNPGIVAKFRSLRRFALEVGVARVEVSHEECGRVVIADDSDRSRTIAVGSKSDSAQVPGGVILRESEDVKVEYQGKTYPAFSASASRTERRGARPSQIVVLWGSQQPLPQIREQATVQYQRVEDPDLIAVSDKPPNSFESADFAIIVTGAQAFI